MKRKKLYKFSKKYVNATNVKIAILFIPLMIIIVGEIKTGTFILKDFYDTSILISFLIVFLCESIATLITKLIGKATEDAVKLETDYHFLTKKYEVEKNRMVRFKNKNEETIYLPVIVLAQRNILDKKFNIEVAFDEKKPKYILPKQIADNSAQIFNAHSNSTVYNSHNVRLNDLSINGNELKLLYSYTTYFDSLLTNRAMDYRFKPYRTVREIYEPGPFLSGLSESKLSNHLGFNGFIELKDGNIIFIKRANNLSIAKGMWQQSIGASLKTKYCADANHRVTAEGISNAIYEEIKDELKIDLGENKQYSDTIFSFYRDLVEGGKPQFVFYCKTDRYDRVSFVENFNLVVKKEKQNKKEPIIDGTKFAFFTINELKKCEFRENHMITENNKEYKMMPSSIASIIMLLNNFDKF